MLNCPLDEGMDGRTDDAQSHITANKKPDIPLGRWSSSRYGDWLLLRTIKVDALKCRHNRVRLKQLYTKAVR
jgi:hypothetical protein